MVGGAPPREPNSPWLSLPGLVSPSRSGIVSWSESNDRATATVAPPGQLTGASERPARTCCTCPRHVCSSHCHGSSAAFSSGILEYREDVARWVFEPGDVWAHIVRPGAHDALVVLVRNLGIALELHAALGQAVHCLIDVIDPKVQNGEGGGLRILLRGGKHGPTTTAMHLQAGASL